MRLQPDVNSALGVRLRPAMYVGGRDYFGYVQYLVCAVDVHLNHGATSRRFRLVLGDQTEEYFQTDGIASLFDAMITPFQVLHQPIHFRMVDGDLDLEVIFVFHSWHQDHVWSFANHGRVPEGGPHHQGFLKAIRQLRKKLRVTPGVLALLSLKSNKLVYKGCIKEKLGDPTLAVSVAKLTARGIEEWMSSHGGEKFETFETFQFAENWYGIGSSGG